MWTQTEDVPERYARLLSDRREGVWLKRGKFHVVDGSRDFPAREGVIESPPLRRFLISHRTELKTEGNITVTAADRSRVTSLHGTVYAGDRSHMILLAGADGHALNRSTFEARQSSVLHVEHAASGDVYDEAEVHLYEGMTGIVRLWNISQVRVIVPYGWRPVYELRGKSYQVWMERAVQPYPVLALSDAA